MERGMEGKKKFKPGASLKPINQVREILRNPH